ncbi:MAG: FtsX-like permease family protein [Pseudomonadota bacterium]
MSRWPAGAPRPDALLPGVAWVLPFLSLGTCLLCFLAVMMLGLGLSGLRIGADMGAPRAQPATLTIVADGAAVEAQARAALAVLEETAGILSVRMIEIAEQRALLEPWLGDSAAIDALPLPLMIEVGTDPLRLDTPALERALAEVAPGAAFDNHGALRGELARGALGLRIFAFAALAAIALAFLSLLSLALKASLAAASGAIETLRLIGARDDLIRKIVTRRFLFRTFGAGLIGALAGCGVLALFPPESETGFYLTAISPRGADWVLPATVPVAAALLAWIAARVAVWRAVRRWS